MRIPYDEKPDDDGMAVTASRDPQCPDDAAAEPPAEETPGGDEEAGYGYGV